MIPGDWNSKIFTPAWMLGVLLEPSDDNEEIDVGFTNNDLKPIYTFKKIKFIPTERFFRIAFSEINDKTIEIATKSVIKLLSTLPYTPNVAVGFNYKVNYEFKTSHIEIPKFSEHYSLNEIRLTREEQSFLVNVLLNCEEQSIVRYNFHYNNDKLNLIDENSINEHIKYLNDQWEQI